MNRTTRLLLSLGLGLVLAVPTTAVVAQAAPAPARPAPATTDRTTAPTTVTVRSGDSLFAIAHRFGIRLTTLLHANSMTVTTVIHPGQSLVIPAGALVTPRPPAPTTARPAPASPSTTTPPSTTTSAPVAAGSYTVQSGDTLIRIARRHGVTLGALLSANTMTVTSLIVPGQNLILPAGAAPVTPAPPAPVAAPATTATAPPSPAAAVAPAASSSMQTVLDFLRLQVGKPYQFFSAGPDAYDCSGLVVAAFRQVGVNLPHQSRAQAQRGTAVDWTTSPIMAGDLIFTSAVNDPQLITHVGVALSSTTWIHAVGRDRPVSIGSIPVSSRIMAVQRITVP
jgi:LysM repeat protein